MGDLDGGQICAWVHEIRGVRWNDEREPRLSRYLLINLEGLGVGG